MNISKTILILMVSTTTLLSQNAMIPTVDVNGEGVVRMVPDEVTVKVRVEHTGIKTEGLKEKNDAVVRQVLAYAKKMRIPEKDIRTEYMNLTRNYDYNSKTYSYAANQSLSIKLRDLTKYEELVSGLLDSGINRIDGISFSSSKQDELEVEARRKAMENAKAKAVEYAGAIGQTVGKAISISEFSNSAGPRPAMYMRSAMADANMEEAGPTMAPGEMEIRTSVQVRFMLD